MQLDSHWLHEDDLDITDLPVDDVPCDVCGRLCMSDEECADLAAQKELGQ